MLTRRELTLVLLTTLTTAGIVVLAQPAAKPVMGSAAIDWNSIEAKTNANGSFRKFFESPTATLEVLECHVTTLNPGASSHPPHQHPEEEVIIIREGTVETLSNGEWKRVGPGSVIFNASNVVHALRNVGDIPAVYHVFMWRSAATPKGTTRIVGQPDHATNSPAQKTPNSYADPQRTHPRSFDRIDHRRTCCAGSI
jgi:quercetin dioxygenase-like cupin family protein